MLIVAPLAMAITTQRHSDRIPGSVPPPAPFVLPTPPAAVPVDVAARARGAMLAKEPDARVGIDVVDCRSGVTIAESGSGDQFYTASVVKLLIAVDALRSENWAPDTHTKAQVQQMLSASDDNIADLMWDNDGDTAIVTRMADLMRLGNTRPPTDPDEWGETLTTAHDVVTIYRYLVNSVPEPSRGIIVDALKNANHIAADGVDQYFGIPNGLPGVGWAVKQGWMMLDTSTTLDSTGLVGPNLNYVVVVLTEQPADVTPSDGGAALTMGVATLRDVVARG